MTAVRGSSISDVLVHRMIYDVIQASVPQEHLMLVKFSQLLVHLAQRQHAQRTHHYDVELFGG